MPKSSESCSIAPASLGAVRFEGVRMSKSEWPSSYRGAKEAFVDASRDRGANVSSKSHCEKGPAGEDLCLNIACIGKTDSKKALVVISGTHGVEGYCGSACQTAWL